MPLRFIDPHFHLWDISEGSTSGHEPSNLFAPDGKKAFGKADYEALFTSLPAELKHSGGVYLEAVSVCHVGLRGPEYSKHCLAEAAFAAKALPSGYVFVPTCALEQSDAREVLRELAKDPKVRGIRQILNVNPACSPRNDFLGELLDKPEWEQGFTELQPLGFSFDLQLNPHQYAKAQAILAKYPDIKVIINHLGQPLMKDLKEEKDQFWQGLEALSKLPNTYMKISMLCRIDKEFDTKAEVEEAVHRVISMFGASRCMFASNYPVDCGLPEAFGCWTSDKLFTYFLKIASEYSDTEKAYLFADTARQAYRM
eukprot:TRINITY_DN111300_c0_g1_i1.p1 TRINITY_DN111300_c0_g1~~TRINITY_DN111300_c0_g1_i1.p1  ORF type:complete len:338 (-),score=57.43 TRINITY_DN111300_c0_g1_i1:97-1032(-)